MRTQAALWPARQLGEKGGPGAEGGGEAAEQVWFPRPPWHRPALQRVGKPLPSGSAPGQGRWFP